MKILILLTGLLVSSASFAGAPKYSLNSEAIYGVYEGVNSNCTESSTGLPCVEGVVTKKNGKSTLKLLNYDVTVSLTAKNGRIVFKWENPDVGDCDDPGCGNILGINGVIYPKKQGSIYLPAIKLFVKREYPYPDEEDAPSGEVVETEKMIKRE